MHKNAIGQKKRIFKVGCSETVWVSLTIPPWPGKKRGLVNHYLPHMDCGESV